jgi:hypothetical protein
MYAEFHIDPFVQSHPVLPKGKLCCKIYTFWSGNLDLWRSIFSPCSDSQCPLPVQDPTVTVSSLDNFQFSLGWGLQMDHGLCCWFCCEKALFDCQKTRVGNHSPNFHCLLLPNCCFVPLCQHQPQKRVHYQTFVVIVIGNITKIVGGVRNDQ